MSSEKISQLPVASSVTAADFFPIVTVSGGIIQGNNQLAFSVLDTRYSTADLANEVSTISGQVNVLNTQVSGIQQVVTSGTLAYTDVTQTFSQPQTFDAGLSDSQGEIRSIPVTTTANTYVLTLDDAGGVVNQTGSNTVTIPADLFAAGATISVYNNSGSNISLNAANGVTLRRVSIGSTGSVALGQYALVTILCLAANDFIVSGTGFQ